MDADPAATQGPAAGGAGAGEDEPAVVLSPSAGFPALGDYEQSVLAAVGHHWANVVGDRKLWEQALPVDPHLTPQTAPPDGPRSRFSGVEFVHWWHRALHNGVASRLRRTLRSHPGIVVSTVPFHLDA